jgi:hypothetical protein
MITKNYKESPASISTEYFYPEGGGNRFLQSADKQCRLSDGEQCVLQLRGLIRLEFSALFDI